MQMHGAQFGRFIQPETANWAKVVKEEGVSGE